MAWEVEVLDEFERGTFQDVVDRALDFVEDGTDIETAVQYAIDDGFMYNVDMLAAIQAYGKTGEAFQLVYEDLYSDIQSHVEDALEEDEDEEDLITV